MTATTEPLPACPHAPPEWDLDTVTSVLRGMIETARQDGYDNGYTDGLAVAALNSATQQFGQQQSLGEAGQRVA